MWARALPAIDSCASSPAQQDALALLGYSWKERTKASHPDLTAEWGHLRVWACPCTLRWGLFAGLHLPLVFPPPYLFSALAALSRNCSSSSSRGCLPERKCQPACNLQILLLLNKRQLSSGHAMALKCHKDSSSEEPPLCPLSWEEGHTLLWQRILVTLTEMQPSPFHPV